jgi:hypothetical protein
VDPVHGSVALCALFGCLWLLVEHLIRSDGGDFATFYRTSLAWQQGQPMYHASGRYTDLNAPTVSVLLWPFTLLPMRPAYLGYCGLGAVSILSGLIAARQRLRLSWAGWCWLGCALILTSPAAMAWTKGQLQLILFYPLVRAWLAYPSSSSGLWLAVAIALKPTVALMALLLPLPVLASAAGGSAALVLGLLPITGLSAWLDWARVGRTVSWIGIPENGSLWGIVARVATDWHGVWFIADASPGAWIAIGLFALGGAWAVLRSADAARWPAALCWSVLVSPVGWLSYLLLIVCPALAYWPGNGAAWVGLALVSAPWAIRPVLESFAGPAVSMSIGVTGVLLLGGSWVAGNLRRPKNQTP